MTREEQIKMAARNDNSIYSKHEFIFIKGAAWADENPVTVQLAGQDLIMNYRNIEAMLAVAVEALEFYSKGKHIEDLTNDLENPSGEPPNWECDSNDKFNLENGGYAREALAKIKEMKDSK